MSQANIKEKEQNEYTTVKLPKSFVEGLVDVLLNNKANGYTSRADVIKAGVRELAKVNSSINLPGEDREDGE